MAPHVRSLSARAGILIAHTDYLSAADAARKAVELALATDDINLQATAQLRFAEALSAAGCPEDAHAAAEVALALYERKGNVVLAQTAREFLARLST